MDITTNYTPKAFSDLYNWVLPDVPGYVQTMVDEKIRDALREFCDGTKLWRVSFDSIYTEAGQPQYELDIPTDYACEIVEIVSATLNDKPLAGTRESEQTDEWRAKGGTPTNRLGFYDDIIIITPVPDVSGKEIKLEAVLRPSISATTFPSTLLKYTEQIANGTKAKLMMMVGQPWSNPQMAMKHESDFNTAIGRASIRVAKGYQNTPLRSRTCDRIS